MENPHRLKIMNFLGIFEIFISISISINISMNKYLSTKPYQHGERTKKHENKGKKAALPRGHA